MLSHFWDIESLDNVFTLANFKETENEVDIYLLLDDIPMSAVKKRQARLADRIYKANENFTGKINLYELSSARSIKHLAKEFGLSTARYINDFNKKDNYINCFPEFRLVCDTDPDYDPDKHPYLFGYNSYNYDTTMLAYFLSHAITFRINDLKDAEEYADDKDVVTPSQLCVIIAPPTAKEMRIFNNHLFEPQFIDQMPSILTAAYDERNDEYNPNKKDFNNSMNIIRKNMLMSGRHIDVARLNEKQRKVALKRLLGMMGHQILESDKLSGDKTAIETIDELFDLIAYNVSDVVNLAELFHEYAYTSAFTLKKGLLKTYPELIYRKKDDEYAPDVTPDKVRNDRLTIDSSSAQFATRTLCPYDHLTDIPTVSFDYPAQDIADKLGIPRLNVLEETKKFFYANFPQPEIRARFDVIYNYYKQIEGKNFNSSQNYINDFGTWDPAAGQKVLKNPDWKPQDIMKIPKVDTCLPYFDRDGQPTSCFVTFSTGGIHGAEYNKELYDADLRAFAQLEADMKYVQSVYPNPVDLKVAKRITMPNGESRPSGDFLKSGSTMKKAFYKDIERKRPVLFVAKDDGSTKIHPKYVYTSSDDANHEDFTSYYPNLLRMMKAFYNPGLGYDRYGEVFEQKSTYGKLMKDETLPKEKRDEYKVLREGVKLILNSASGAGDATFESNIRMNNQIISMRIIGQLFSYRIGQAQALKGAKIISTNTDGLYSVLEEELNNKILAEEAKNIHVDIEPEPMSLISKDTNNRIEYNPNTHKIYSVSGGTLACADGPNPTKALAHPAVIDYALREYLIKAARHEGNAALDKPFDEEIGRQILIDTINIWEPVKWLNMFQNLIASSNGSQTYIYKVDPSDPSKRKPMQHYNRVFIMKDGTTNTSHLYAATYRVITKATLEKRKRDGEATTPHHDMVAMEILRRNGAGRAPHDKEAVVKKVTNIEPEWFMFIQNKALRFLTDTEKQFIMDNIDIEKYLQLVKDCFEDNWFNRQPAHPSDDVEITVKVKKHGAKTLDSEGNLVDSDGELINVTDTEQKRGIYDILYPSH